MVFTSFFYRCELLGTSRDITDLLHMICIAIKHEVKTSELNVYSWAYYKMDRDGIQEDANILSAHYNISNRHSVYSRDALMIGSTIRNRFIGLKVIISVSVILADVSGLLITILYEMASLF